MYAPPDAASALPNVCSRASTRFSTPSSATSPRPPGPYSPVAWASSTTICAFPAGNTASIVSSIAHSGATLPSILYTLSTATNTLAVPARSVAHSSRSAQRTARITRTSLCANARRRPGAMRDVREPSLERRVCRTVHKQPRAARAEDRGCRVERREHACAQERRGREGEVVVRGKICGHGWRWHHYRCWCWSRFYWRYFRCRSGGGCDGDSLGGGYGFCCGCGCGFCGRRSDWRRMGEREIRGGEPASDVAIFARGERRGELLCEGRHFFLSYF